MLPCHALMVRFDSEWAVDFDAAFVGSSSLGWIARNASKPNREDEANWVLHSTAEWSEAHLDLGGEEIRAELLGDLEALLGAPLPAVRCFAAHRWLYARPMGPFDTSSLVWDREIGLGACGDWVCGDRVEDAFLSAERLADAIRIR